jgi:hypothetical protein
VLLLLAGCSEPARPGDAQVEASVEASVDVVTPDAALACDGAASLVCNGACVDVSSSAEHCGMCGRACTGGGRCVMGACQPGCGLAGLPCCAGDVCEEGAVCTAGACVANRGPQPVGRDLVSAGGTMTSTSHALQSTLGQSTQHQAPMSSPGFRLQGGLVGVIGRR